MSQKFGSQKKSLGIFTLTALLWIGIGAGCDPCHQLAEKICKCRDNEDDRRTCINNLGLANEHRYFKDAKDPEVCEQALKNCSCEKINDNQDAECGMYRPNMK